tara:strand:+ start:141 stop:1022 length:882 start_codon:yes stop_codon:yes gene_type:complete
MGCVTFSNGNDAEDSGMDLFDATVVALEGKLSNQMDIEINGNTSGPTLPTPTVYPTSIPINHTDPTIVAMAEQIIGFQSTLKPSDNTCGRFILNPDEKAYCLSLEKHFEYRTTEFTILLLELDIVRKKTVHDMYDAGNYEEVIINSTAHLHVLDTVYEVFDEIAYTTSSGHVAPIYNLATDSYMDIDEFLQAYKDPGSELNSLAKDTYHLNYGILYAQRADSHYHLKDYSAAEQDFERAIVHLDAMTVPEFLPLIEDFSVDLEGNFEFSRAGYDSITIDYLNTMLVQASDKLE